MHGGAWGGWGLGGTGPGCETHSASRELGKKQAEEGVFSPLWIRTRIHPMELPPGTCPVPESPPEPS